MVGFQLAATLKFDAMDPLGGEHPPPTQGTLHPRHSYLRMVGKELGKILGIIGFFIVVDFGEQTAPKFIDNVPQSKAQIQGQEGGSDHPQGPDDGHIPSQYERQIGPLHLHRYKTAIGQSRLVDLPQTGRCHRVIGEFIKQALGRGPQFGLNHLEGSGVIKGGQIVLQARQFFKPVPSHQIGAGGKGLAHLDETGPQAAQGGEDAPGQPLL